MKKLLVSVLFVCLTLGAFAEPKAKNIILLIADGMGPEAAALLVQYARYKGTVSNYERFANMSEMGMMLTNTKNTLTTDSACSGTQIATGVLCNPEQVGVDYEGVPAASIMERARGAGRSVGLVTTVYLQDATPAVFVAHEKSRSSKGAIAKQMMAFAPEVLLGGGLKYFRDAHSLEEASAKGYDFAYTAMDFDNLKGPKILGLFGEEAMPFAIEKNQNTPTLKMMSEKALEVLAQNKNGFFVMIEAGAVDWAEHAHDAAGLLHELLAFDEALGYLIDYAAAHKDTLLIVSADHSTGGFGFEYSTNFERTAAGEVLYGKYNTYYVSPKVFDSLELQTGIIYNMRLKYAAGKQTAKNMQAILKEGGIDIDEKFIKKYKTFDAVLAAFDKQRGITWSSLAHTSTPVTVLTYGPGADKYKGLYHTTDLNKKMTYSLGLKHD